MWFNIGAARVGDSVSVHGRKSSMDWWLRQAWQHVYAWRSMLSWWGVCALCSVCAGCALCVVCCVLSAWCAVCSLCGVLCALCVVCCVLSATCAVCSLRRVPCALCGAGVCECSNLKGVCRLALGQNIMPSISINQSIPKYGRRDFTVR